MSFFGSGPTVQSGIDNQPTTVKKLINQTAAGQSQLLADSNAAYQAGKNYQQYGGNLTAGTNATEQAGIDQLGGVQAGLDPIQAQINQVGGIDHMLANNPDMIQKLYNPYQQQVIDTTLSDMDIANQRLAAQRGLTAGKAGAFGGSRAGVADALAGGEYARAVAAASGGLRKEGFDTASGLATKDLDRAANSDTAYMQTLGNLYGTKGKLGLDTGEAMLAAGKQTRETDQAGLDAAYQQFLEKRDWPWTNIQRRQAIISQRDPAAQAAAGGTTTSAGDPGIGGTLLGTGTALAGAWLACDVRLKTDIRRVATLPSGAGIFHFRYRDDPDAILREGPIAQDIARFVPGAAVMMANGMLAVRVEDIR